MAARLFSLAGSQATLGVLGGERKMNAGAAALSNYLGSFSD
jgi:hypothetical protein